MMDMSKTIGPYVGVSADEVRTFANGRTFRFVLYGAYNAFGLIGPEKNGIAVLDENNKAVVCDEIALAASGYHGPTAAQLAQFATMTSAEFTYHDLMALVNNSPRARALLTP